MTRERTKMTRRTMTSRDHELQLDERERERLRVCETDGERERQVCVCVFQRKQEVKGQTGFKHFKVKVRLC